VVRNDEQRIIECSRLSSLPSKPFYCQVYVGGPISGAHYNGGVSLAVFFREPHNHQALKTLGYIAVQTAGALAGG